MFHKDNSLDVNFPTYMCAKYTATGRVCFDFYERVHGVG